ncbi:MAG TPA: tRNA (adenosine(37)-N6)-dimethylallyltransferase MiaA [Candidatus Cloacimonadota bacterium]|jgi:tRNA dimethylallyltransferase|nr:tRNA (adenosine(37)-N6)-dimethylallyltransferase MiaA [Candidatus Cloacimonadales bacterium]HPY97066.1 tRNA (adenosine(37)-N6)-dimethylallyltransferase MiaA [Candidatus Cloacimonadota bacterium]HQB41622.1 tRNA (adenosine(37)-N6)-dimethylallyltransferase MiaA [Candidatus Cloacimonadota bacterium]
MIPLIIIQGATGSGKSQISLELSNYIDAEIVSADSRQIYRYMDIGTAKVSKEDQKAIKHHLINIIDPNEKYSAGAFVKDAECAIECIIQRGKVPIICGGTGMYIKALTEGIFEHEPIPNEIKADLQELLDEKGLEHLYNLLYQVDEEYAANIYPQDKQRVLRALEVYKATGRSIRELWSEQEAKEKYRIFNIWINPNREELYRRINKRMDRMIEMGLIEEISKLLEMGYNFRDYGLNSVGYKEYAPYFAGFSPLYDCIELAKQHSRNYAKRQITWYKKVNFNFAFFENRINLSLVKENIECFLQKNCK